MVDYLIPKNLSEVLEFIDKYDSKLICGGTDLMVQRRNWAEVKAKFNEKEVYIFNLFELKYIKNINGYLHIGACTPVSDILKHEDTPYLLKETLKLMASPALRNLATLPGNIMNASPAGDTLPILYVLNAEAIVKSTNGEKRLYVKDIITGPRRTILDKNEMITEVIIPIKNFTNQSFIKVGGRKADAISKLSFTGAVDIQNEIVKEFRISFGAVAAVIIRNEDIEKKYRGLTMNILKNNVNQIINDYSPLITPIDDQRSNKEYRKQVAINLLKDFILNL